MFERVNVDSLIVFDHNSYHFWTIRGRYCAKDRTGVVNGIDESTLVTNQTVLKDPYIHEFTGSIFPIYELENTTVSIPQASEILLGEKWVMPFDPVSGFRPNQKKNKQTIFTARSGVQTRTRHYQERTRTGTFEALPDADLARYLSDWLPHHFDDDYPFAVRWSDGETPMLMINHDLEAGETYSNLLGDWRFKFKEVL